jgi:hypothetical protein
MRAAVGVLYWFVVGLLALHALYVSFGESRLWPGLLVPVALALLGAVWPGLGHSGAALIAFGLYPALLITGAVLGQVFSSDWSCSTVAFDDISNPNGGRSIGGSAGCTTVSIDLILFALLLWATALLGAVLLYRKAHRVGA